MSLRRRMVVLTAAAVALAVLLSAIACYLAVAGSLRGRLNHQLEVTASSIAAVTAAGPVARASLPRVGPAPLVNLIPGPTLKRNGDAAVFAADGALYRAPQDHTAFKLTARDLAVARGSSGAYFQDRSIGQTPVRVYVRPAGHGRGVIAAVAVSELHGTLHNLAAILAAIAIAGILLAGIFGLLVARAAAAPVHALRHAAEHVGSTGDLSRRIKTSGEDDLSRLGQSFNRMLGALADSRRTQQQLIEDASHELRTPVASLRMNAELLAANPNMDPTDRSPLLDDVIEQSRELGTLIDDLLETARDTDDPEQPQPVDLEQLIATESERWSARNPGITVTQRLEPCEILGRPDRLRRAVSNILDNAFKWSPPTSQIDVTLTQRTLTVRDYGSGFEEGDLPLVFDRFYRSSNARAVPGSGLGLSIVRKVALEHEGSVAASNDLGGGAVITLTLGDALEG